MRTNKILSVLMAIFIFAALFGMTGAVAEEAQAAGEITAQATAYSGWPTTVELSDEAAYAGAWNRGLIQWTPFVRRTGTRANAEGKDETYTMQNSFTEYLEEQQVELKWEAFAVEYVFDANGNYTKGPSVRLTVEKTPEEAAKHFLAVYSEYTSSKVYLNIRQGTRAWYGEVIATLTVTAPNIAIESDNKEARKESMLVETNTVTSEPIKIIIRNSKEFTDKIGKAQKILNNSSRYNDKFIGALQREVNVANLYVRVFPEDASKIDATMKALDDFIKAAPNNMQLTSWAFLNNTLPMGLIRFIWSAIDVFGFVGRLFGIIINPIKALGSLFGAILKFFSLFTPFFSVFSGLLG